MALLQGIQEAQKSQKFSRLRPSPNKDEEEEEEGTISELDRGVDELKKWESLTHGITWTIMMIRVRLFYRRHHMENFMYIALPTFKPVQ